MSSEVINGEIVLYGAPTGRPSVFSQQVADEICSQIAAGEPLTRICKRDDMPHLATVYRWLQDPDRAKFCELYREARDNQADTMFDQITEIADDGTNDYMEQRDKDDNLIGWRVNGEHVQRSKLRIDARKWQAARLRPKKYGERTILGGDPDNPLLTVVHSDLELARIIVFQLAKAEKIADSSPETGETIDG